MRRRCGTTTIHACAPDPRSDGAVGPARRRLRHERDDRGASIVLLGIVLVVLMIFAAFSVDVGTAYAQRRQNQGAVDTAALAGGMEFLNTGDFAKMIADVKARVADDMGTKITDADWAACTDPNALAIPSTNYSSAEGSPCISFGRNADTNTLRMRVRLPDVASATSFASAIGIDQLDTHAVAEIDVGSPLNGAFPAFVLSGTTPGSVVCVLSGPGGHTGPCTDPSGGQFGTFQPYYYADGAGCPSGNQGSGNYYSQGPAIAEGLDHLLSAFPGNQSPGWADLRLNGGNNCTVLGPNSVKGSTGFSNQTITLGLLLGNSNGNLSYQGRLVGGPYSGGAGGTLNTATMGGLAIDNVPLWYFLKDPLPSGAPAECKAAAELSPKRDLVDMNAVYSAWGLTAYHTPEELMAGCLAKWTPSVGPILDADFAKSRRAVSVPRFWETQVGNGNATTYHIRDFVPMFLAGEFQKQNGGGNNSNGNGNGNGGGNGGDSASNHWAGDPISSSDSTWNPGSDKLIESEAGIFIPCGALPDTICRPSGDPGDNGFGGQVNGVTLTH